MKAVIYARYSSDNQREESIEGQIRECTAFAEKNGITILRHYIDRAFSAKTDNRPEFQSMIKDSGKRLFDMVIVWKLDRFARNRYDSARYKATLKKNGVKVVSATEVISDGAEGIILESVLEGYAEYYSADLSEKVVRGMTENALKSKYNGGTLPIGYTINSEQYFQLDPLTAPFVLEAFKQYAEGATMKEIRDYLNEHSVKNTRGQPLSYNSVQHLLNNRRYIGEYTYRDIVVPDGIPAIVSQDLFDRVQERLAKNKKAPARHKAEEDYLLTTKLFCGYCGAYLCGESGTSHTGNTHRYYKCVSVKKKRTKCHKRSVKKDWIEDLVVSETMKMVMDDKTIEAIVAMLMNLQDQENINLPLYEQQLREADRGIQNLLNAIQQGILTKSTKSRLEELEAAKEELETKIACEKLAKPKISAEFMTFWLHRFRKLDVRQKSHRKMLIDTFINAIFLYDDKMVITFNYKEGTDTITFDDLKASPAAEKSGSDLDCLTAPRRCGLRIVRDDFFSKSHLSLTPSLLLSKSNPLRLRQLSAALPLYRCPYTVGLRFGLLFSSEVDPPMDRKHRFYQLRLSAWQRRLLVGALVALTGQLFLSAWAEGFRVSAAAVLYPVLLVVLMRDSHLPDAGVVTGLFVLLFRMGLDLLGSADLSAALLLQYPGGVFYVVYDCLLCLLLRDRRSAPPGRLWLVFGLCDFCSNTLNLLLSGRAALELRGGIFLTLAALAVARSFAASAVIWLMASYRQFLLRQEHELRYQRLILMTAELKTELYFLRKSAEETEQVMANAYRLYERTGELSLPEEDRALALSIARDVHEVKKDNLRIIRGLEHEVAETRGLEAVSLSDLLGIVESSTRHLLGEQRADIRLEVRCLDDFLVEDHYQLISVLKNLVTNAVEAIQSGTGRGTVQVEARVREDCLCLEVRDDGPGIPPRAMDNLFQVGYSTKFDPETGNIGRGVGLPSVRHAVRELGGEIRVDAAPGQGACFLLKVPIKAVRKETPA